MSPNEAISKAGSLKSIEKCNDLIGIRSNKKVPRGAIKQPGPERVNRWPNSLSIQGLSINGSLSLSFGLENREYGRRDISH
jgi:hypothetical protein